MNSTVVSDYTVIGDVHALDVENGRYTLYRLTPDGTTEPLGSFGDPATAMNALDAADGA